MIEFVLVMEDGVRVWLHRRDDAGDDQVDAGHEVDDLEVWRQRLAKTCPHCGLRTVENDRCTLSTCGGLKSAPPNPVRMRTSAPLAKAPAPPATEQRRLFR